LTYFILSVKLDENGEADVPIDIPSIFVHTWKGMAAPHIFFNESGYLNSESFPQIIDHFIRTWKLKHPGLHCCLLGDNVSAHRDLKVIKKGLDNGVYLNFLVKNTTHWSQPLDNLLFARLKQEIVKIVRQLTWLQIFCEDGLFSLIDIILTAAVEAFTVKAVMKAFCDTGFVPYNRAIIEDLA
jgi:hypothetical protein